MINEYEMRETFKTDNMKKQSGYQKLKAENETLKARIEELKKHIDAWAELHKQNNNGTTNQV